MPSDDKSPVGPDSGAPAKAQAWLAEQGDATLRDQVELARIPAPPFQERRRAEAIAAKLEAIGVRPHFDEIGNLLAWYPTPPAVDAPAPAPAPAPTIIATHMDTVFGPETPIEIRPEQDRWVGPGVTDNARGLAVALSVLRALVICRVRPDRPMLFAFTVGEEGAGDLRGVKHLFAEGSPLRDAAAFIAIDGSGLQRIIHHALGSRRFRVSVRGTGGHSWTDWGRSNPANAIGDFIHHLCRIALPQQPRTTLTVARLGGGTSINAIPAESWVEIDIRSQAADSLNAIESQLRTALEASVTLELERGDGHLSATVELIGERPAASLSTSHALVQAAAQATRALGVEPSFATSSTDANVPLALGIPAIAVGGGGESANTHTTDEWFENTNGAAGPLRVYSILSAIAGF